jgi:hypothetical protein
VFLALGQQSEYYKVLQLYEDDEYTVAKTSLVRPAPGFPAGAGKEFRAVELTTLDSVSQSSDYSSLSGQAPNGQWSGEQPNGIADQHTPAPVIATKSDATESGYKSSITTFQSATAALPVAAIDTADRPEQQLPTTSTQKSAGAAADDAGSAEAAAEDLSAAGVVQLGSSTHSSSQSNKAAPQSWELTASENIYNPLPIQGAWGEEPTQTNGVNGDQNHDDTTNTWQTPAPSGPRVNGSSWREPQPPRREYSAASSTRGPRQFEGSWDDLVQQEPRARKQSQLNSPTSAPDSATVPRWNDRESSAFTRVVKSVPEPYPAARPVRAPVALNRGNQRIDLKLPLPTNEAFKQFDLRSGTRKLCNEHHLRFQCTNPRCPFDHEDISDELYLVLRNKARRLPCSSGPDCRRHDCHQGHHCANVTHRSTCGKQKCPFQTRGMHEVTDLEIVTMIDPPGTEGN